MPHGRKRAANAVDTFTSEFIQDPCRSLDLTKPLNHEEILSAHRHSLYISCPAASDVTLHGSCDLNHLINVPVILAWYHAVKVSYINHLHIQLLNVTALHCFMYFRTCPSQLHQLQALVS